MSYNNLVCSITSNDAKLIIRRYIMKNNIIRIVYLIIDYLLIYEFYFCVSCTYLIPKLQNIFLVVLFDLEFVPNK